MIFNKQTYLLIVVMTTIVFIVEALTISALYNTAFEKQREQLEATVRGQATLISAVADFDSHFSPGILNA